MGTSTEFAKRALNVEQMQAARRVLKSTTLARSTRVAAVFGYLIGCMENGSADAINEHAIGEAVFQRAPGYDSSEDNIVRVTVRNLRAKLEEYYQVEGAGDPWRIEIPKGSYVPVFHPATPGFEREDHSAHGVGAELPAAQESESRLGAEPARHDRVAGRPWWRRGWNAVICVAAASCLAVGLYWSSVDIRGGSLLDVAVLTPQSRLHVVVVDAKLQAYRVYFNRVVPLRLYIDQQYLLQPHLPAEPEIPARLLTYLREAPDTSATSAIAAALFSDAVRGRQVRIRHPREVTMRDFEADTTVLLGGPWINPWGQLFEERLNFQMVPNELASGSRVKNRNPQPGELPLYAPSMEGGLRKNFARVAIVRGLSDNARVVLVGATSGDAIEAACRFLVSAGSRTELVRYLGTKEIPEGAELELVLEVTGIATTPMEVKIVAHRMNTVSD